MLAAGYGTISDIEVVWVLIALVGVLFGIFNTTDAIEDREAVDRKKLANGRKLFADSAVYIEYMRLAVQIIFLVIGVAIMTIPDPPSTPQTVKIVVISAIVRWGLISASAILLAKSIYTYFVRKQLLR